jgi:4-amino-4-deoxy-L-arabinose transferase-like glycosyltransferase
LGFNIKMLQALMPLPAFYALYFFGAPHKWWRRIAHLTAASVLLVAVSLAWAVVVDLTPAEDRPYVGSSETNSMLELILGHNGIRRLTSGAVARSDGAAGSADGPRQMPPFRPDGVGTIAPPASPDGAPPNDGILPPPGSNPSGNAPPKLTGNPTGPRPPRPGINQGPGVDGPGDGANRTPFSQEVGQAGALRMFTAPLVDEASWLLPFALLGLPILIAVLGVRWPLNEKQLGVILWGGWLIPTLIYFSFTTGLFHAYYVVMLGPPLAALVGASAWALHKINSRYPWRGWILIGLLTAATILVQAFAVISFSGFAAPIILSALLLWLAGFGLLALQKWDRTSKFAYALLVAALAVGPAVWSFATTLNPNASAGLPNAGPAVDSANRRGGTSELSLTQETVLAYLLTNTDPDDYLVATTSSHTASPFILATGRAVLTFGGFSGGDDVITVEQLAEMVADEEIRFVIFDGSLQQRKPEIATWIQSNCSIVPLPGLTTDRSRLPQGPDQTGQLFDCGSDRVLEETIDGHLQ